MKKLLVCMTLCALLLSVGTVFSAAELPENVSFTPGKYLGGDPDAYSPVGEITVAWLPDVSDRVDMTDGDLSDWYALGLTATNIDAHNMIAWVGDSTVVGDFKITSFAAADADYLYLTFDVVDSDFAYGSTEGYYDGDAIQLALDIGRMMGEMLDSDPDALYSGGKNVFYSFSCVSDGAPVKIMRQESANDGWLTEANGDGVKGAAKKTDLGWSAEIALSWQLMVDDWVWKDWNEEGRIYVSTDDTYGEEYCYLPVGACLYYLDRGETAGDIQWAAGTVQNWQDANGTPMVSWTAYDNGITWTLPIEEGVSFSSENIVVLPPVDETSYDEVTEPPYDPPVEYPDTEEWVETETQTAVEWHETIPPEVEETLRDAAEDLDAEDELNAILEKYGCTAVVSMGSLTVLVTVVAAAFVIRKKK